MDAILKNKVVLAMIILVLGALGYYFFFAQDAPAPRAEERGQVVGREVIETLDTMQAIDLDGRIFEDPVFNSLEEMKGPIPETNQGRVDPFAPVN